MLPAFVPLSELYSYTADDSGPASEQSQVLQQNQFETSKIWKHGLVCLAHPSPETYR